MEDGQVYRLAATRSLPRRPAGLCRQGFVDYNYDVALENNHAKN